MSPEQVNGPAHYNGTELIDDMVRRHGPEKVHNFCELNSEKYCFRAGKKLGNTIEQELSKAAWYDAYAAGLYTPMWQYHGLLQTILSKGTQKTDRTGTGTLSIFGPQMRFNLAEGFPLVTTKKVHLKSIIHELLWFLQGDTNIRYLVRNEVNIWNEWPYEAYCKLMRESSPDAEVISQEEFVGRVRYDPAFAESFGNLGPVYGYQWRSWPDGHGGHIDQIAQIIQQLQTQPDSRRMVVSAWNVADLPSMKLPACHALFQFYTRPLSLEERTQWYVQKVERAGGRTPISNGTDTWLAHTLTAYRVPTQALSCQLYQRSADVFLGVPFNIASYALLTLMMAQVVNMAPGEFIWTGGDTHLYSNHVDQAREQLGRVPRPLPTMRLNPAVTDLFGFRYEDFTLTGYDPHPAIKAPVAV